MNKSYFVCELLDIKVSAIKCFVVYATNPQEAFDKAKALVQQHFPEIWDKYCTKHHNTSDFFGGAV